MPPRSVFGADRGGNTCREMDVSDKRSIGLFSKFSVIRVDGTSEPGRKHDGCDYFVLDITHDPFALAALLAYAADCEDQYPELAKDLRAKVDAKLAETAA